MEAFVELGERLIAIENLLSEGQVTITKEEK
jgi:hypothetical protein